MVYFPPWGVDPYDSSMCPPMNFQSWEWVEGECSGNTWVYAECEGYDRPTFPPAWYHDDLLGVLRYWRI